MLIEKYGGTKGIMIQGTIDHLVNNQLSNKNTVHKNAAITIHAIATGHAFFDGNKRTAFATTEVILQCGGYKCIADKESIKEMLISVAKYEASIEDIEKWMENNTAEL